MSRGVTGGRALGVCLLASGCWSSAPTIDGFTDEQWAFLATYELPALTEADLCPPGFTGDRCTALAQLGQRLFFEPALSGRNTSAVSDDPSAIGVAGQLGVVACSNCHDTTKYFTDTRSQPGQVSIGPVYTKHNSLGLVNIVYKRVQADKQCGSDAPWYCDAVFSWNGQYATSGEVLEIATHKAMCSSHQLVANAIHVNPSYVTDYEALFGPVAPACTGLVTTPVDVTKDCAPTPPPCRGDDEVFGNLESAFDAYENRLAAANSPFDRYIAGDRSALSDDAKAGLGLFIGKAMCVDCHQPPLFSDLQFHNTGVPQIGAHVASIDDGLDDTAVKHGDTSRARLGMFLTQPLRNVSETSPYMHDGAFGSLADVIEFYRGGGVAEGFAGDKDPRIQPLEIDDDEAHQLEAFLRSLTGDRPPVALTTPNPTP
jgi:cytochrome c peroxidase